MKPRMIFLASLLLLPVVTGVVGLPIAMSNPDMKSTMARVFFASLTISGAGQALFFGKRGTAFIILVCGVVLIFSVR